MNGQMKVTPGERIFIIGFMASGKTTIGKLLAGKLSLSYYDTDELIEKKSGLPIYKIFERYGEDYFRKLENEILVEVIEETREKGGVIATGGGLPCYHNNIELMKNSGRVVYIKVSPEDVLKRIKNKELRPVYRRLTERKDPLQEVKELLKKREKYYNKADICIAHSADSGPVSIESIIEEIIRSL